MVARMLRAFAWPMRRLHEGYGVCDLPALAVARVRGLSYRAWEEQLNERETQARAVVLRSAPRTLFLEITGHCPIVCLMCARRYRNWSYGDMEPAIFERLIHVVPRVGTVVLGGFGEPLVARNFDSFFDRLSSLGAQVALQTSGYRLTQQRAEHLVTRGLRLLHISVDSPEAETYASIRPRISFSDVTSRIRQIVRLKQETGVPYPAVHVVFVAMRRNIEQLPDMVDLAAEIGADNLTVQYLVVHGEDLRSESLFYHKDLASRMLDKAQARASELGLNIELPERFGAGRQPSAVRCLDPWKVAFVRWDGEVRPCCYAPHANMGSLAQLSFWQIWNGPAYRQLRHRVNSGDPPRFCLLCTAGRLHGVDAEKTHIALMEREAEAPLANL